MSLRDVSRRLWIDTLATLRIDALSRRRMGRSSGPVVRVVLIHGTPRSSAEAFRRQLDWAGQHFDFITFEQFKSLWTQPPGQRAGRPKALFTFDDGLLSNHEIAAPLLEEFGTRGVFLVVPRFSLAPAGEEAKRYFHAHLEGYGDEDCQAMSPAQIRDLVDRGHTIGNHTYSHVRLSETAERDLEHEIIESAAVIESWIGRTVETFAWTFSWDAVTPAAYRVIRQRHAFCFSPCQGVVQVNTDKPGLIWRTNVEAGADLSMVRFMYSGLADGLWAQRRAELARRLGS